MLAHPSKQLDIGPIRKNAFWIGVLPQAMVRLFPLANPGRVRPLTPFDEVESSVKSVARPVESSGHSFHEFSFD